MIKINFRTCNKCQGRVPLRVEGHEVEGVARVIQEQHVLYTSLHQSDIDMWFQIKQICLT